MLVLTVAAVVVARRTSAATAPREQAGQFLALLPSLCLGFLRPRDLHRGRLRRRPRGGPARPGGRLPGLHDHRPPRRAADGPAQHRLDAAGVDAARRDVLRPGPATACGPTSSRSCCGSLAATALAQVVGWLAEGVRRGPRGIASSGCSCALLAGCGRALVVTQQLAPCSTAARPARMLLARLGRAARPVGARGRVGAAGPRRARRCGRGRSARCPPAGRCTGPMREELRLESGPHPARPHPSLGPRR